MRINLKSSLIYTGCFAAGSCTLAGLGYLGGHIYKLILPSIVPSSHALALGLWAPSSLALLGVAMLINRKISQKDPQFGLIVGLGYFVSVFTTQALGHSVTVVGPFLSLASLSLPLAALATAVGAVFLTVAAVTGLGRNSYSYLFK